MNLYPNYSQAAQPEPPFLRGEKDSYLEEARRMAQLGSLRGPAKFLRTYGRWVTASQNKQETPTEISLRTEELMNRTIAAMSDLIPTVEVHRLLSGLFEPSGQMPTEDELLARGLEGRIYIPQARPAADFYREQHARTETGKNAEMIRSREQARRYNAFMRGQIETRILPVLGLLLTYAEQTTKVTHFLHRFALLSVSHGVLEDKPELEHVAGQRQIRAQIRTDAMRYWLIEKMVATGNVDQALDFFVQEFLSRLKTYKAAGIENLQAAVTAKSHVSNKKESGLIQYQLWENPDALAMMCMEHGLRQLLIDFRNLFLPKLQQRSDLGQGKAENIFDLIQIIAEGLKVQ